MSTMTDRLIVGLGNPGPKYARNRHNIGFMVVDEVARRLGLDFRPAAAGYLVAERAGVVLLKPRTYMNLSGEALRAWSADRGIELTGRPAAPVEPDTGPGTGPAVPAATPVPGGAALRPLVVCDDLALPLGSVRLRSRGSSGGQNGLESVIACLGGGEFPRLRLGIAPLDEPVPPAAWPDYVLADFAPAEADAVADLVAHAADALVHWLDEGLEATISRFNRRIRPTD